MVGMPGRLSIDLSPAWQRELVLRGAYGYGVETEGAGVTARGIHPPRRTFDLALDAAAALRPGRLVGAPYALSEYREALAEASSAGRRGAVKVTFAPQMAQSGEAP